ncbi:MAG TPA: response regulator transcription factor, partial [Actinomycetota bacterium]|nr:response regulator transcription factor [Actinomycetota bacterium]
MTADTSETEAIRVIVVDDHPVWRDGIRADLEASGVATVVGEASDGGEAIELAHEQMPDVVLMDLRLPTVSGVDATRRIVEGTPHIKILIVSASGEEADVLEAVKVGAAGYILKSERGVDVVDAVRRVHAGEPVFTSGLAGLVLSEFRRVATKDVGEPGLSPRENEVLHLVAKGYTYREIAEKLFISQKTVQNHVQNILTKLHLRKRYELMRYAIQKGLDRLP